MKSFLTACFFVFLATQIVQAQVCLSQDDCEVSECCAGFPFAGSFCKNHTAEGKKCHLVDKTIPLFGEFIIGPCPCAEGLICVPKGGPKKNDGICTLATTLAPEVSEEPAGDDTPIEEPAGDDTPVEEPAGDSSAEEPAAESSAEEPAGDVNPAEEPAGNDNPAEEPAGDDTPAEEPLGDDTPAEEPAGDDTPAEKPAADSSAGEPAADSSAADSAAEA